MLLLPLLLAHPCMLHALVRVPCLLCGSPACAPPALMLNHKLSGPRSLACAWAPPFACKPLLRLPEQAVQPWNGTRTAAAPHRSTPAAAPFWNTPPRRLPFAPPAPLPASTPASLAPHHLASLHNAPLIPLCTVPLARWPCPSCFALKTCPQPAECLCAPCRALLSCTAPRSTPLQCALAPCAALMPHTSPPSPLLPDISRLAQEAQATHHLRAPACAGVRAQARRAPP